MNLKDIIFREIENDPEKSKWNEKEWLVWFDDDIISVQAGKLSTARTLYWKLGPSLAETILTKLESAIENPPSGAEALVPILKRIMPWLIPSNEGVDMGTTEARTLLDMFQVTNILSFEEVSALKSLSEITNKRYLQYGIDLPLLGHIQKVLAANGK